MVFPEEEKKRKKKKKTPCGWSVNVFILKLYIDNIVHFVSVVLNNFSKFSANTNYKEQ